jgi:hypothetical protein
MCDTLNCVKTAKRNLTLSLPTELVRNAKVRAAERGMSLNAWIQQAMDRTLRFDRDYVAAGEKFLNASSKGLYSLAKRRVKREELYDR